MNLKTPFFSLLLFVITTLSILAFPGDLDTSFNQTGRRQVVFGNGTGYGNAVAVQNDGKSVVAGFCTNGGAQNSSNYDLCVTRFDPSGSIDTTFGENGTVITTTTTEWSLSTGSVAIQSDGKIIVAGLTRVDASRFKMVFIRYNMDGSLDSTFGEGGKVLNLLPASANQTIGGLAIQADGKIVIAGSISSAQYYNALILRLNQNGTFDQSFGTGGSVTFGFGGDSYLNSISIQSDGKLVVAGTISGFPTSMTAARLLPDGALDAAFGTNGKAIVSFGSDVETIRASLQPDGKLVIVGDASGYQIGLARLGTDGNLDQTFNGTGKMIWGLSGSRIYAGSVSNSSAGITVVGRASDRLLIVRFLSSGALDVTFNTSGFVRLNTDKESGGAALVEQPDGSYVVCGYGASTLTQISGPALFRFSRFGQLDLFFGDRGIVVAQVGREQAEATAMAIQPDGKIIVAGSTGSNIGNTHERSTIVRLLSDGMLDTSFGDSGKVILNIGLGNALNSIYLLPDGRILGAGYTYDNSDKRALLVRLDNEGRFDQSFGKGNGIVKSKLPGTSAEAMVVQSDGKIILLCGPSSFLIVRFNPDGTADRTFDEDGYETVTFNAFSEAPSALALQMDGKIIVCGLTYNNNGDTVLARLNVNGSLDTSFGIGGKVVTDLDHHEEPHAVSIQQNGKIVTAGSYSLGANMFRYNSDGSLDTAFGIGGRVITNAAGFSDARAIVIQPNGKMIVAGETYDDRFGFLRLNADGTLDETGFGTNGVVKLEFGNRVNAGRAIALESSGRIVAAGIGGGLFGVVRLKGDRQRFSSVSSASF